MSILVMKDGQQYGPYTQEQIQAFVRDGNFLGSDLLWYEGLQGWQPIESVFPAQPAVQQTPAAITPPTISPPTIKPPTLGTATAQQTQQTPRRPATREPIIVEQEEKSMSTLVKVGIGVGSLVVVWLGVTFVVSLLTKAGFVQGMEKSESMSLASYKTGLFSSRAETVVGSEDDGLSLKHKIWHGPLAFPNGKPKLGIGCMTTTLKQENKDSQFSVFSEFSLGGDSVNSIDIEPMNFTTEDGLNFSFDGGYIKLKANADQTKMTGDVYISPVTMEYPHITFSMDAIKGTADYRKAGFLEVDANLGGITVDMRKEPLVGKFTLEPPVLSVRYRQHSDEFPIFVGKSSLKFPLVRMEGAFGGEMSGAELSSKMSLDSDEKANYSSKLEVGKLLLGDASQPMLDIDKTYFEFGYSGLEAELMAALNDENMKMQTDQIKSLMSGVSPTDFEDSEMTLKLMKLWMDMIRPGVGVFTKIQLGGPEAKIDLSAGFGGDKKLTETKNLREVVAAIEADLDVKVGGTMLENPLVGMQIQGLAESGMGVMNGDSFQMNGVVRQGTVFINEKPTPFIEMLGPMLDEPVDWEEMLGTLTTSMGQ